MSAPTVGGTEAFVTMAHHGQVDKAGRPYIEHVFAVAHRLRPHGEWAYLAGLLHDWVEDCDGDLGYLYDQGYPDIVVEAVDAVSRRDGEEYEDFVWRASQHPLGCLVKLADNLDNSNEQRLLQLPKSTATRLRRKYAQAREILEPALLRHAAAAGVAPGLEMYGPEMPAVKGRG